MAKPIYWLCRWATDPMNNATARAMTASAKQVGGERGNTRSARGSGLAFGLDCEVNLLSPRPRRHSPVSILQRSVSSKFTCVNVTA